MALCPVVVTPCIGDHLYCKQPAENSEFQQENGNTVFYFLILHVSCTFYFLKCIMFVI